MASYVRSVTFSDNPGDQVTHAALPCNKDAHVAHSYRSYPASVAGLVNAMALSVAPSLSHPSPSPEFEASQPGTEISEISERF